MKIDELAELVQQMRAAQAKYFRMRRTDARADQLARALSESKELERRVDKACDDVANKQPRLFE